MPAPLLFPLISAGLQAGTGLAQLLGGALSKNERPEYQIPEAAVKSLGVSQRLAQNPLMAGYDMYRNQLDESTARAQKAIRGTSTSSAEALGALVNVAGNEQTALNQLNLNNEQDYVARQKMLGDALSTFAGYEKEKWAWDEQAKYEQKAAAKSALLNAGINNIFGGVQSYGQSVLDKSLMDKMFPAEAETRTPSVSSTFEPLTPRGVTSLTDRSAAGRLPVSLADIQAFLQQFYSQPQ